MACSLAGAGSSSGRRRRMLSGIAASSRASRDAKPSASSIARTSPSDGPMCRRANASVDASGFDFTATPSSGRSPTTVIASVT